MVDTRGDGSLDKRKFISAVKSIDTAKGRKDDAQSDLGNAYQRFEEIGGNRGPLKLALKLRDMDGSKRSIYWRDLLNYLHMLGVDCEAQGDLIDGDTAEAGHGQANGKGADKINAAELDRQGYEAGKAGKNADLNPIAKGEVGHRIWADGWKRGQDEIAKEITSLDA